MEKKIDIKPSVQGYTKMLTAIITGANNQYAKDWAKTELDRIKPAIDRGHWIQKDLGEDHPQNAYVIIKADGGIQKSVPIADDFQWERFEDISEIVGGWVEYVYDLAINHSPITRGQKAVMCVNEQGMMLGLPVNEQASKIAGQEILGDVLLTPDWTID